jgi:hypothetical protein
MVVGFLALAIALLSPSISALLSFYASSSNAGAIMGIGRSFAGKSIFVCYNHLILLQLRQEE